MVHEWMLITLMVKDADPGVLGPQYFIKQYSSQNMKHPIYNTASEMPIQQFFLSHLKVLEAEGWEVFSIDMYHVVPWQAILKKPVESNS
ncbi:MAG: hypothetical protein ACOYNC_11265 [Bacteroidales bacterium]